MATVVRLKGKSVICFPNDYVSFDLETTGFSPCHDEIIDIGAVRVHNGKIVDEFQSLVKPKNPINNFITELTGISNEMVSNAPVIDDIILPFRNFVGDTILLGHNVSYDVNFIYDSSFAFDGTIFDNDYVDTMRIARRLYPDMPHHRLKDLAKHLDVNSEGHHRALADCIMASKCFEIMRNEIHDEYDFCKNAKCHRKRKSPQEKSHNQIFVNAKSLSPESNEFDTTHPLYGKSCVFTGTLERMSRKNAMQIVLNCGGTCENNVTKKTNFLILGDNDYCLSLKDGKSAKHKKAEEYKLKGYDIEIIPENVFYEMLGDYDDE
jgi:DNA polymerase-3 subunit epsilon